MKKCWKLSEKQKTSLKLIDDNKYTLLIGKGRSGKTLAIMYLLFKRAIKYPKTNHAIFRNTLSSCVDGIWKITIPEIIKNFFPALPLIEGFKMNESSHEITFHNGSRIVLRGLDTKERAQKVLSTQYASVFIDEAHLVDYEYVGLLLSRMPQPLNVQYRTKVICAANWAPKTSWLKVFFQDKNNPETKSPHLQECNMITFETSDNKSINAEEYLSALVNAGDRRSRLACAGDGFYEQIEGALWKQDDIRRIKKLKLEEYDDIVIAFDPAVTNTETSDEHGICIAGLIDETYHIIEAFEKREDINIIAKEIAQLYHSYSCSKLIYESNQGGDFIPALISNHDESVYCEGVRAKKAKLLRAEPICALYKNQKVYHTKTFQELEDQMLTYTGKGDSPNALDALVYAVKYLSESVSFVNPDDIYVAGWTSEHTQALRD